MNPGILLDRLDGVRRTGDGRWMARCPAHQDRSSSLSIKHDGDRILIHCFAGCGGADVLAAIGMEFSDLYPPNESSSPATRREHSARDALRALAGAANHVFGCATILRQGLPLTERDMRLLVEAAARINSACGACGIKIGGKT